ncbi:MAG: hypothetical protein JJU11_06855 [Candidatus Sumerlaeia bacterium]|nr:hypothetical protein [Candidatus Sumerlaeia bacterium]
MDYDDIVKGRRRNWESLKPDEIRKKEKEAERERKREEEEKHGKRSVGYFEKRQRMVDEARERDLAKYRQTIRLIAIGLGAFAFLVVTITATSALLRMRRMSIYQAKASEYDTAVLSGERIRDYSDPVSAFASWRGAWIDTDPDAIIESYSNTYKELLEPSGNMNALRARYASMVQSGALEATRDIAISFLDPELFRIPSRPWRHEQLALLRSQPFERFTTSSEEESVFRYMIAFSYDSRSESWRFADLREEVYFSVRWQDEGQIRPLQGPARATRYDSTGRPLN